MSQVTGSRPSLVVWFPSPPQVEAGAFGWLIDNWGAPVRLVAVNDHREERVGLGWQEADALNVEIVPSAAIRDPATVIRRVVGSSPAAQHVFIGMFGAVRPFLDQFLLLRPNDCVVLLSERPGAYGPRVKRLRQRVLLGVRYRRARRRLEPRTLALLPFGDAGVQAFSRLGWPIEKLVSFMYCPPLLSSAPDYPPGGGHVRFIYIGRFSRFTKGTDVLIAAVERMETTNWTLDLVGGHGDFADEVIEWASDTDRVTYRGSWTPAEVQEKLGAYDVCVVPSRFDGWNVVVNEALAAGVPVIATDQAVSHELVTASGAGQVVPAGDSPILASAMDAVNAEMLNLWRAAAVGYQGRIAPDVIGEYFAGSLDYALGRRPQPPQQPWK